MKTSTLLTVAVLLAGCVCGSENATSPGQSPESNSSTVTFAASDGTQLSGIVAGGGTTGLVLCHGRAYTNGAESFTSELAFFGLHNVTCMALNFRGYPSPTPPMLPGCEQDIIAAVDYLVEHGAKRVFVLGSSMGGFIALDALPMLEQKDVFAGIILVSAYSTDALRNSSTPKLILSSESDSHYHPLVMAMYDSAAEPKSNAVYETGGHGQRILSAHGEDVLGKILEFMQKK